MLKFSIIVPCYNIENSVKNLFDMLSPKNYDDYEVIFVDDCSKDNSFEIMKAMATEYVNFAVYQPEKNGGPGLARNLGLQYARGEYIIFCDSDDKIDTDVLLEIERFLADHAEVDMLVSPHRTLKNGNIASVDAYDKYAHGAQVDKHDVVLGNLAPWGKVYRSDIIKGHQIEFPARRTGEDICFVVNYVTKCNTIYKFDVAYYGYVVSKTSITHKKSKDSETTFDILQPIYHEYFPTLEVRMFAQNHLLTKVKYLTDHNASIKQIKDFYRKENLRYPNWIQYVDIEKQSMYRKQIYKAMYYNRPLMIKIIMLARRILH